MKSTGAYADCQHIFDLAVKNRGVRCTFPTYTEAVLFRKRCNGLRVALREQSVLRSTPFDEFILQLDPPQRTEGPHDLIFRPRVLPSAVLASMRLLDGTPLTDTEPGVEDPEDDELMAEAREFASTLGVRLP